MVQRLRRIVLLLAVILTIATPATAHVRVDRIAPTFDRFDPIAAQNHVQPLQVFVGSNAFDEVARVELPPPSVADELARRFASTEVESPRGLRVFDLTVNRKLASGLLGSLVRNNVNESSELTLELRRTVGNLRNRWYDPSTGTFLSPDAMGYQDSSNLYAFCANDPVNCSDPDGLARRTKSGGVNYIGDWGDEYNGGIGFWAVTRNTIGNTASDLLMLDTWADANVVAWDSSRSGGERAWAATKGVGVAALNLVGGEIVGTAGKVLLKIPGAKTVVSRVANSGVGRVLTAEVNPLRWFDDLGEAAARGLNEGAAEAIQQLAPDVISGSVVRYSSSFAEQQSRRFAMTMFNEDIASAILSDAAPSFGRPGGTGWVSPASANFAARDMADLVVNSGRADTVVAAANQGGPIYGAMMPWRNLRLSGTTANTVGANVHFTGRGHTAVFGETFMMYNPAALEMLAISRPMAGGGLLVKFIPGRGWVVVKAY